jgi:hypothetical protein
MTSDRITVWRHQYHEAQAKLAAAEQRAAAAEAELAELRRDQERLDWLERRRVSLHFSGGEARLSAWTIARNLATAGGSSLREAIDALKEKLR